MVPGSCDTCAEPAPLYDESSTYCGRHLPAEVFYLTIPRPDCDTCGADAAAEYYSVGSGFSVGVVAPPAVAWLTPKATTNPWFSGKCAIRSPSLSTNCLPDLSTIGLSRGVGAFATTRASAARSMRCHTVQMRPAPTESCVAICVNEYPRGVRVLYGADYASLDEWEGGGLGYVFSAAVPAKRESQEVNGLSIS